MVLDCLMSSEQSIQDANETISAMPEMSDKSLTNIYYDYAPKSTLALMYPERATLLHRAAYAQIQARLKARHQL